MNLWKHFFFYFFLFVVSPCIAQTKLIRPIDSAIAMVAQQQNDEAASVKTCFYIADEYMELEQYDSAQIWLNKIHLLLPVKNISRQNYFLHTRQAEVYYYNNLQHLGLQESRRSLAMAIALNDSVLLADSYNFLGLFYMNIDSTAASVKFYETGLRYTRSLADPASYIGLSKPHHLYGNLAEAYYKLGQYDSALHHSYLSLREAGKIDWQRGIGVAYMSLGDVYAALGQLDSSLNNYIRGSDITTRSNDIDVALVCYGGIAKIHQHKKQYASVDESLDLGFNLLQQHPNINRFYALTFLNTAIGVYKNRNQTLQLVKALELKSQVERANIDGNNKQIQTILDAGLENEKRLLGMQVAEAERRQELANTRLIMALIGIGFLAIGFFVYRYYQNQKIAISQIKNKISQDLHDDIGASLSSLQIYGSIAEQSIATQPAKAIEMVNKISVQTKEIMENLNDIVWSMKSAGNNTPIEIKIKNFAAALLSENAIAFTCAIAPNADALITGITARKNILLIVKEALNNIAKYSKGTSANLSLQTEQKELVLTISDNGIGFDTQSVVQGNGLENMQHRTKELGGSFHVKSGTGGTVLQARFTLTNIN